MEQLGRDRPACLTRRCGAHRQLRLAVLRGRLGRQPGYDSADLSLCETLYGQPSAVAPPYFTYGHDVPLIQNDACTIGRVLGRPAWHSSPTRAGAYPPEYDGALFFADYSRNCIWVMQRGRRNAPEPAERRARSSAARRIRSICRSGPAGDLFYVDLGGSRAPHRTIRRHEPCARRRARPPHPTAGERAPHRELRRDRVERSRWRHASPTPGTSTPTGPYDDSTAARPTWTYDKPRRATWSSLQSHRRRGRARTPTPSRSASAVRS